MGVHFAYFALVAVVIAALPRVFLAPGPANLRLVPWLNWCRAQHDVIVLFLRFKNCRVFFVVGTFHHSHFVGPVLAVRRSRAFARDHRL